MMPFVIHAQGGFMVTSGAIFHGTNGSSPQGELIQGTDGLLYGAAGAGGSFGRGTVFKSTLDGSSVSALFSFNGTNGSYPVLTASPDGEGNSYGFAIYGGNGFDGGNISGKGTIYKLGSNGVLNTLVFFNGTNGNEPSSLIFGSDGNLYGTTLFGGAFTNDPDGGFAGDGTVFKITTNGDFTLLACFNGTNGVLPRSLIEASDGSFYGVTGDGGDHGWGTVFRMTIGGEISTLFSFNGTNGASASTLIQGSDGALYGTTAWGGDGFVGVSPSGAGTVFRITTNGDFNTVALLSDSITGSFPIGRLLEVTNGVFYGTTVLGGPNNQFGTSYGTMFQIKTNGELSALATFKLSLVLPFRPITGVTKASDGNYYGAAAVGDLFCVRPIEAPVLNPSLQGNQVTFGWKAWAGYSYLLYSATNINDTNWTYVSTMNIQTNGISSYSESIGSNIQQYYKVALQIP